MEEVKRYAMVKDGVVENIVLSEPRFIAATTPIGCTAIEDDGTACVGGEYKNGKFHRKPITQEQLDAMPASQRWNMMGVLERIKRGIFG